MQKSLIWVKKAFNRNIEFVNADGNSVGRITFKLLDRNISAVLNETKVVFQITGIINKTIFIYNENSELLGQIILGIRSNKAEIYLKNGLKYLWQKDNFFLKKWSIFQDLPDTNNDPLQIEFDRHRNFLDEFGNINILDVQPNSDLLSLIGFFIGWYFIKRKRKVASAN